MTSHLSLIDEMKQAARGVAAVAMGDRKAAGYFDFSQLGLLGSFIALLTVTALNIIIFDVLDVGQEGGGVFRTAAATAIMFAAQTGFAALALRQMQRFDVFVPYLIVDNWVTFFVNLALTILILAGVPPDFLMVVFAIAVIVFVINVARLIMTLLPMQIAIFVIALIVGVIVGQFVVYTIFPPTPDELEAIEQVSSLPS